MTDNFNDNSINFTTWGVTAIDGVNAGVTVAETGGESVFTPMASTAGTNRNGLLSNNTFNLTQGFAIWKLAQKAGASASVVTRCGVAIDANNYASFEVADTVITFRNRAASVNSDTTATYSATNHKYLMIHHCGNSINWYTSVDGIVWASARLGVAPGFAVTALKTFMDSGTTASVSPITPSTAIFDDIEIGTLDFDLSFEQMAAFAPSIVTLEYVPGFPLNIDIGSIGGGIPVITEGQGFPFSH